MSNTPNTPLLIAHRGGSREAPENTMASFRHAISIGMTFIELDVQLTKDDVMVVMHDETLDRTTNGSGPIRDYTFEEVRRLDAGSHFGPEFAGEKVPTLREVLELCLDAGVGVVIELKEPKINVGVEERLVALLGEMWTRGADNLWCISFDHDSIRKLHKLDPGLPLGFLYEWDQPEFASNDEAIQACCPYFRTALSRPDQIDQAHVFGKFVLVYTVDTPEDMRAVAEAGIDGMVSDRPSLLLKTFNH